MEVIPPVAEDDKSRSDVLLFNRWTYDDVQVRSLTDLGYIALKFIKYSDVDMLFSV